MQRMIVGHISGVKGTAFQESLHNKVIIRNIYTNHFNNNTKTNKTQQNLLKNIDVYRSVIVRINISLVIRLEYILEDYRGYQIDQGLKDIIKSFLAWYNEIFEKLPKLEQFNRSSLIESTFTYAQIIGKIPGLQAIDSEEFYNQSSADQVEDKESDGVIDPSESENQGSKDEEEEEKNDINEYHDVMKSTPQSFHFSIPSYEQNNESNSTECYDLTRTALNNYNIVLFLASDWFEMNGFTH